MKNPLTCNGCVHAPSRRLESIENREEIRKNTLFLRQKVKLVDIR